MASAHTTTSEIYHLSVTLSLAEKDALSELLQNLYPGKPSPLVSVVKAIFESLNPPKVDSK